MFTKQDHLRDKYILHNSQRTLLNLEDHPGRPRVGLTQGNTYVGKRYYREEWQITRAVK